MDAVLSWSVVFCLLPVENQMKNRVLDRSVDPSPNPRYAELSKLTLFALFAGGYDCIWYDSSGRMFQGIVNRIEREDGSNKSWNLTLHNGEAFHVRTVD